MGEVMLYDLGKLNVTGGFFFKLGLVVAILCGVLGAILALCITLSIAVRIGNFILGF